MLLGVKLRAKGHGNMIARYVKYARAPHRGDEVRGSAAPHMEFRAKKETPGKGKDLLSLDCIT